MTDYNNDPVTGMPSPHQPGYPDQPGYPVGPGGYPAGGHPGYSPGYPGSGAPVVLTIGDIAVTQHEVIVPQGRFPLRGTTWTVQDSSHMQESIPAYAIVLAVIFFFFCLLGLLFLLIKERKYTGMVIVSVAGEGLYHSVQLPPGPGTVHQVTQQVNQARAMAAMA
ncbi:hypothetical protein LX16_3557 [Stackebrandtia albiflava]|uniref:Uncharacterized protein n=1 Tax=Stackebrandtia albiflava TaxID=406432 RepID=A0A562V4I6_9ACTN|nr:hypothetical protein [Stackebrandtia albiflava]TWJ12793.1 hypothetical protein LX16_3557 [Stackebrandtia albiflava]